VLRDRTAGVAAAQQRPPDPHFHPAKGLVDSCVVREFILIKVKKLTEFSHVFQPIRRFTVAVLFFDPETVQDDVDPAGEPAAGGLARVLP
jgi:hypothetical protein